MRNQSPSLLIEDAAPSGKLLVAAIDSSILQDVIGSLQAFPQLYVSITAVGSSALQLQPCARVRV